MPVLILSHTYSIRGVEEVDAVLVGPVHELVGAGLVGDPPEVHRPEAEPADRDAAAAEMRVLHGVTLERGSLAAFGSVQRRLLSACAGWPHATRGPFRDESWCLAGVSRVGASRASRTCESSASRACDSRVSRSCEERLRTGANQSPTTASATANQAARPISTHHHAFMPTSPCGQHPQHQVIRTRPPPLAKPSPVPERGLGPERGERNDPAPRTLSSERPAPERGLCAICALPLGETTRQAG